MNHLKHWHIPVLLLAVALLYTPFLGNPFVFDDLAFFVADEKGWLPVAAHHFSLAEFRSLPYATFVWSRAYFGLEMWPLRLGNLLLHGAVVSVLFLFLAKLFEATNAGCGGILGNRQLAFFAALLFALHPVAVYAAGYLIQRTIVMAALFSLLAMLAYLHGSLRQQRLWLWACVPLYYLAVFSKEHVIMLPAALLALTVLLHEDWPAKLRQRWGIFLALATIALFAVIARKELIGAAYEPNASRMLGDGGEGGLTLSLSVLTQSWLFFKYAGLWLFPNPAWMSVDMREPFAQSWFSPYLGAFAAFLAWGAGASWLLLRRGRWALVGFAMLFPWLMFMTEFSTVRIQEIFVLYRSYLWAIGAACILPLLVRWLDGRLAVTVMLAAALAMFPVSMERLSSFSQLVLLWQDAEKLVRGRDDLPGVHRIYYNLGSDWLELGAYDRAVAELRRATELIPGFPAAHGNLGVAYFRKREWANALAAFNRAAELAESSNGMVSPLKFYYGRALSYEKLGDVEHAKADYRKGCEAGGKGCEDLKRLTAGE